MSANPNHYSAPTQPQMTYTSQEQMSIPPPYSHDAAGISTGSGYTPIPLDSQTPADKELTRGGGDSGSDCRCCSCCDPVSPDGSRNWLCAFCIWIGCFELFALDCWGQCANGCMACCTGMCNCNC
ncbi:hypothetical protein Dda_6234 [Drechslerella dactyloides]|uniref:Uncharacterized protein n=1 Tax=Drechslerella dactyloides TaxID=74499 RepID=A0AAD6IVD3_DREDA|nr:hypothetical protein Dda_6234 [Drechslerella dactyloides]